MKYSLAEASFGPSHAVAKGSTEPVCEWAVGTISIRKNQQWLNTAYPADLCAACRSHIDHDVMHGRLEARVGKTGAAALTVAIGMSTNMVDSPLFDAKNAAVFKRLHELDLNARIEELLRYPDDELQELVSIGLELYEQAATYDNDRMN